MTTKSAKKEFFADKWLQQQRTTGNRDMAEKLKPEILISLEPWHTRRKFGRQIWGFRPRLYSSNKLSRTISTTIDNRKWQYINIYVLGANLAISGWRRCRNPLAALLSSSSWSKMLDLPLEFWWYLPYLWRYKYFRFWRPYCYFRLSIVLEITVFEIVMVDTLRFAVEKTNLMFL